ncbi:MAG: thiol peroxidase [Kiritimatiellae bacterium]|nr:thiol peroxidase [Kiritimatiellia bacterium]
MTSITFKGDPVQIIGELPRVGNTAPDFTLTAGDLLDKRLSDFSGKIKILSIVPSLDTPVCAISVKRFNQEITSLDNIVLINISADLPFAQTRFCEANDVSRAETLSTMRSPSFGKDYGVTITEGPLAGLLSRAVVVLDQENRIMYSEHVPDIAQEPDYEKVLVAVKAI